MVRVLVLWVACSIPQSYSLSDETLNQALHDLEVRGMQAQHACCLPADQREVTHFAKFGN